MKKIISATLFLVILQVAVSAQTVTNGFVVLNDGNRLEGNLTEQFKKSRSIQMINASGKQMQFYAESVKTAKIDSVTYSSFENEFFQAIWSGDKYQLVKKETKAANTVTYNGTEPIMASATEGNVNDLFIYSKVDNSLTLLTKKNFRKKLQSFFPGCTAVDILAEKSTFDKESIALLMKSYQDCK